MTNEIPVPLVSVVIPTHNRAKLLDRAIRSVLNQTYTNLECIVVDDASSDNTQQVISAFIGDERVVSLRHEINRHGSAARNTGIAHARGELVALLDDDDEWLPTKLQKQVDLMNNSPKSVGLIYCWMDYYGSDGSVIAEHHTSARGYIFPAILRRNIVGGCPTLLLRKSIINTVGMFDENLTLDDDYEFIIRVCKRYEVDVVEEVLVRVDYGHGLSQTSQGNYDDQDFCLRLIRATEAMIRSIGSDSKKYRKYLAYLLKRIAFAHGCLGNWASSIRCFALAFRWNPFDIDIPMDFVRLMRRQIRMKDTDER